MGGKIKKHDHLCLQRTTGRFGNNIFQLFNIVMICETMNCTCSIQHKRILSRCNWLLDIKNLENLINKDKNIRENQKKKDKFFNLVKVGIKNINMNSYFIIGNSNFDYFNVLNKYFIPYLKINPKPLNKKICCIHIRSGDIFKEGHHKYTQPPLAYYQNIINIYNDEYGTFLIITEKDMKNPVINELKKHPKVKIQSKSLKKDFKSLLSAQSLVISTSTLTTCAVYLSKNIKRVFVCDLYNDEYKERINIPSNIEIIVSRFKIPYISKNNWKNTKEQLDLMINYKTSNIYFKKI